MNVDSCCATAPLPRAVSDTLCPLAAVSDVFVSPAVRLDPDWAQQVYAIAHAYKNQTVLTVPWPFTRRATEGRFAALIATMCEHADAADDWPTLLEPISLRVPVPLTGTREWVRGMMRLKVADVHQQTRARRQLGVLIAWSKALVDHPRHSSYNPVRAELSRITAGFLTQAGLQLCATRRGWVAASRREIDILRRALARN